MADAEAFRADLEALGFRLVQDRRTGVLQYARRDGDHLTWWVHWDTVAGQVLFTWELAIGEFFSERGLQIGANEELNQFLFPKGDARGPQDIAFVVDEMDRAERVLRGVNLLEGT